MASNREMLADAQIQLNTALAERRSITKKAERENREHLTELEESKFIAVSTLIKELRERVNEFQSDIERRGELRGAADRIFDAANGGATAYRHDAYTDRRHSYVRDLVSSVTPAVDTSGEGRSRLGGLESRDVSGLTSSTAFDPPQFLLDMYARASRPNAPLYSLLQKVKLDAPVVKTPQDQFWEYGCCPIGRERDDLHLGVDRFVRDRYSENVCIGDLRVGSGTFVVAGRTGLADFHRYFRCSGGER